MLTARAVSCIRFYPALPLEAVLFMAACCRLRELFWWTVFCGWWLISIIAINTSTLCWLALLKLSIPLKWRSLISLCMNQRPAGRSKALCKRVSEVPCACLSLVLVAGLRGRWVRACPPCRQVLLLCSHLCTGAYTVGSFSSSLGNHDSQNFWAAEVWLCPRLLPWVGIQPLAAAQSVPGSQGGFELLRALLGMHSLQAPQAFSSSLLRSSGLLWSLRFVWILPKLLFFWQRLMELTVLFYFCKLGLYTSSFAKLFPCFSLHFPLKKTMALSSGRRNKWISRSSHCSCLSKLSDI